MRTLAFLLLSFAAPLAAQQFRAFWADAFHPGFKTPAQVDAMLDAAQQAKANTIIMQARRRGDTYYLGAVEPVADDKDLQPGFDALQYLVQQAHARGLQVQAWFVIYPCWRTGMTPNNPQHVWTLHGPTAAGSDNWANYNVKGAAGVSLDPGHPAVGGYLADVVIDVVRRYEVDAVHFDYVRYPEDGDYGYNPASIARFQRQMNRAGFPEAKDPAWSEWRRRQVTDFVRQTYLRVQALRPQVLVTAAFITWGNGPTSDAGYRGLDAYARVFQDWRGWLEEGIIDAGIPMNYFRESTYATYLDRWTEFMKDGQGRRMLLSGLGVYLNTIEQTLQQLPRVLRPSAKGNTLGGVAFYSYSATDSANTAQLPNAAFYTALGEYFGAPAAVPELPWKTQPVTGHLYGTLRIDGYPEWLHDGAGVVIRGAGKEVRRLTDASGFFGAVELDPGDYTVTVEMNGQALHTTPARRVEAGKAAEFAIALRAEDAVKALPALVSSERPVYAPGDIVVLQGRNLAAAYAPATAVPLPLELAGTMVVVNGVAAPLFAADPNYLVFQLPFESATRWQVVARRAGVESLPMGLDATPAAPLIRGVRRAGEYLEIYATGLGATDPPMPAGTAVPSSGLALPVAVLLGDAVLEPVYAGVLPYQPASYQVNVRLPAGVTAGQVRLKAGAAVSPAARFE